MYASTHVIASHRGLAVCAADFGSAYSGGLALRLPFCFASPLAHLVHLCGTAIGCAPVLFC